jgi:hypothetical protein
MGDYGKFSPKNMKLGTEGGDVGDENDAVTSKKKCVESKKVLWGGMEAVEEIAMKLIPKHHPELASARFKFVCRDKAAKKHGELVRGKAYKMSRMYEYLVGCDFVIEVALETWNDLNTNQRIALVDHLLAHCVGTEDEKTGSMKWSVRPPEIQEFPEVAERNGQWHEGLVELEKCLRA